MREVNPTLAAFLLLVAAAPAGAAPRQFFVSLAGDDANPGTKARPFASLEREVRKRAFLP